VTAVILLFFCLPAFAATYYVPDDFSSIQAALDGAANDDIIIVRDGTYTGADNKNLDFAGKALTLRSENGPANCIIDCQDDGRGFVFQTGETSSSILEGFTITNGSVVGDGGGIYISVSSPSITNCVISNCATSAPLPGMPVALDNDDIGNGGGIYLDSSATTFTRCVVAGNSSASDGGGIYCTDSDVSILNCNVVGNSTPEDGGGIEANSYATMAIINCTIADNSSEERGGGIDAINGSDVTVINSILWGNSGTAGNQIGITGWYDPSSVTVQYSDVEGGQAGVFIDTGNCPSCSLTWGDGNINETPQFVGGGDYHLTAGSPCINTGTDAGVYDDIDGDSRPQGVGYDMGSDEYSLTDIPAITLSKTSITSPCEQGTNALPRQFGVWNSGAGTLSYTITDNVGWLSCSPTSGTSTGERDIISVTYNTSSLAVGAYVGVITITDPNAANNPQTISVNLTVTPSILTHIYLKSPADQSTLTSPPTFTWVADGGVNNGYAVDLSYSSSFTSYWSTYKNLHIILSEWSWTMPSDVWERIEPNREVFWRVRGADQSIQPLTVITSGHWRFTKQ